MKTILSILIMALFAAACTSEHVSVPEGSSRTLTASERGLSWIVEQQNSDGSWGTDEHRRSLTSLATLALLYHGVTPASREYGNTLVSALGSLIRDATDVTNFDAEDRVLLTWCLAEAYGITKVPMLLDPIRKHAAALEASPQSPWHAFAAHALFRSGAAPENGKQMLARLKPVYASRSDNIIDQATYLLILLWGGDWNASTPYLESFRRQESAKWRLTQQPVQAAVVLSLTLLHVGGKDWIEWNRIFYPGLFQSQITNGTIGWWTVESLGVDKTPEADGMTADESRIFTTCMMLLTLHQPRILPSFRPVLEEDGMYFGDEDDIMIEISL